MSHVKVAGTIAVGGAHHGNARQEHDREALRKLEVVALLLGTVAQRGKV